MRGLLAPVDTSSITGLLQKVPPSFHALISCGVKRMAHGNSMRTNSGAITPCQAAMHSPPMRSRGGNRNQMASSILRAHLLVDAWSAAPAKARLQSMRGPCGLAWRTLGSLMLLSRERCAEPALSMNRVGLRGS